MLDSVLSLFTEVKLDGFPLWVVLLICAGVFLASFMDAIAGGGGIISVPVSHGEGRFLCSSELLKKLAANGQIATQYVDLDGNPTMDVDFNPNGSAWAVEGITSPDGRVLGKMGHSERTGATLYKNVPGNYDLHLFESARDYFSL